jgi:tRNA G46 methylase TrmB
VQDATIMQMSRILDPAGEFRFVSDIDDYCSWTLMHMQRSKISHGRQNVPMTGAIHGRITQ